MTNQNDNKVEINHLYEIQQESIKDAVNCGIKYASLGRIKYNLAKSIQEAYYSEQLSLKHLYESKGKGELIDNQILECEARLSAYNDSLSKITRGLPFAKWSGESRRKMSKRLRMVDDAINDPDINKQINKAIKRQFERDFKDVVLVATTLPAFEILESKNITCAGGKSAIAEIKKIMAYGVDFNTAANSIKQYAPTGKRSKISKLRSQLEVKKILSGAPLSARFVRSDIYRITVKILSIFKPGDNLTPTEMSERFELIKSIKSIKGVGKSLKIKQLKYLNLTFKTVKSKKNIDGVFVSSIKIISTMDIAPLKGHMQVKCTHK